MCALCLMLCKTLCTIKYTFELCCIVFVCVCDWLTDCMFVCVCEFAACHRQLNWLTVFFLSFTSSSASFFFLLQYDKVCAHIDNGIECSGGYVCAPSNLRQKKHEQKVKKLIKFSRRYSLVDQACVRTHSHQSCVLLCVFVRCSLMILTNAFRHRHHHSLGLLRTRFHAIHLLLQFHLYNFTYCHFLQQQQQHHRRRNIAEVLFSHFTKKIF